MRRLLGWLPLAVGLVLAFVLALALPGRRLYVSSAPALIAVEIGLLWSLVLLAVRVGRRRVTARQRAEVQRVREAGEQARRRFIRRLDHELKNPLTALLAALTGPPGPLSPGDRAVSQAQADRIRRLLSDLRRVADVETVELDRELVDIGEVLREAVDLVVSDGGRGRAVGVSVASAPWPVPKVLGDRDLLLVAAYNVVGNALKYSGPDDLIEVRASERALAGRPGALIEVADTGPGVPAEDQGIVWEELARGSTVAGVPGSGIGLALVAVIVERHGGEVALRSRHGHGTSVTLHLPGVEERRA